MNWEPVSTSECFHSVEKHLLHNLTLSFPKHEWL